MWQRLQALGVRAAASLRHATGAPAATTITAQQHASARRANMRACMAAFEVRVAGAAACNGASASNILAVICAGEGLEELVHGNATATAKEQSKFARQLTGRGLRVATHVLARRARQRPPVGALVATDNRTVRWPQGQQCLEVALELLLATLQERERVYGTGRVRRLATLAECSGSVTDVIVGFAASAAPRRALDVHQQLQRCVPAYAGRLQVRT